MPMRSVTKALLHLHLCLKYREPGFTLRLTCICELSTVLLQASSVRLMVSMASTELWICVAEGGTVVPLSAFEPVVLAVR